MHTTRDRWQETVKSVKESPQLRSFNQHVATFGLFVTIGLQILALLCRQWYVLYVDIDACNTCGQLIVETGMAIEKSMSMLHPTVNDEADTFEINRDAVYADDVVNIGDKDSVVTIGGTGDVVTIGGTGDFQVQHAIFMQIGLWSVLLCTDNTTVCDDLELSTAMIQFGQRQPFKNILDSVHHSRPFILLSLCFTILTLSIKVSSKSSAQIIYAGTISVVLTLLAVVIAGLGYLAPGLPPCIQPGPPVSLMAATLSMYISSILLSYVQIGKKRARLKSIQSWNLRYIHSF